MVDAHKPEVLAPAVTAATITEEQIRALRRAREQEPGTSKRISKRVREEAARLCSSMAAHRAVQEGGFALFNLNADSGPERVAWLAFAEACWTEHTVAVQWAEAEALLRTGWSP